MPNGKTKRGEIKKRSKSSRKKHKQRNVATPFTPPRNPARPPPSTPVAPEETPVPFPEPLAVRSVSLDAVNKAFRKHVEKMLFSNLKKFGVEWNTVRKLERVFYQMAQGCLHKYRSMVQQAALVEMSALREISRTSSRELYEDIMGASSPDEEPLEEEDYWGDPEQCPEGFNQCYCGSRRVRWRAAQERSADEMQTTHFFCTTCKKRWSHS